jgi:hypothetical protein
MHAYFQYMGKISCISGIFAQSFPVFPLNRAFERKLNTTIGPFSGFRPYSAHMSWQHPLNRAFERKLNTITGISRPPRASRARRPGRHAPGAPKA